MNKLVLLALLGSTNAIDWDKSLAFSTSMKCGACIRSERIFCIKGQDAQTVKAGARGPVTKCCEDATCIENKSI